MNWSWMSQIYWTILLNEWWEPSRGCDYIYMAYYCEVLVWKKWTTAVLHLQTKAFWIPHQNGTLGTWFPPIEWSQQTHEPNEIPINIRINPIYIGGLCKLFWSKPYNRYQWFFPWLLKKILQINKNTSQSFERSSSSRSVSLQRAINPLSIIQGFFTFLTVGAQIYQSKVALGLIQILTPYWFNWFHSCFDLHLIIKSNPLRV